MIQKLTSSLHVFSQTMRVLDNYGLVEDEMPSQGNVNAGGYSMHSGLFSYVIPTLNAKWKPISACYAIDATAQRMPCENDAKTCDTERQFW